jgi:predicted nucleic acid-binding Zn ribbon protein
VGGSARGKRGPVPIAEIIASVSRTLGRESAKREKIDAFWQKAAGKKRAPHTKVSTFDGGALTILVDSSSILYELTLEKEALLGKLQKELGKEKIKDIRLFHGSRD